MKSAQLLLRNIKNVVVSAKGFCVESNGEIIGHCRHQPMLANPARARGKMLSQIRVPVLEWLLAAFLLLPMTSANAACAYQSIAYGQTVNGSLSVTDCTDDVNGDIYYADYYQFTGTTGDKIYIQQSSTSIDPWLMLIFPSGNYLENDDGGGGTTARIPATSGYYTLPESGTYLLEATSAYAGTTGNYGLVLAQQASAAILPGAPTNVTATAGNGSATVAFTPGSIGSGTLVTYWAACGIDAAHLVRVAGSSSPISVTGLTNGTAYTCRVQTESTAGTGSLSLASNPVTPSAPVVIVPANGTAIEFYKADIDHYFMTADAAEATALDNNTAWKWTRTGKKFKVWLNQASAPSNASPVCRFFGVFANGTVGSHFYTIDEAECAYVKSRTDWGWNYESNAFHAVKPIGGTCPTGTSPVFRVYNNGMGGAPNHRYMTSQTDVDTMIAQKWASEGVAMCASGSASPAITGGSFIDPSGRARVDVATGTIPPYVNASGPTLKPVTELQSGIEFDAAGGEVNVTLGGPGYEFDLTGDSSFVTTAAGAITISLTVDTTSIPVADRTSPVKVFMRIYNLETGSNADVTGEMATTGGVTRLTVETRGLPNRFVALVVYNPNMDAALVDAAATSSFQAGNPAHDKAAVVWPSNTWCVTYNPNNATLIAQIKAIRGTNAAPTREEIKNTISYKLGARKAQLVYERDGFLAPNLYTGKPCGGNAPHYVIHMSEKLSSAYRSGIPDQDEEITADEAPFGRIHVQYSHTGILGDVVAHELHHAIQSSYSLNGNSVRGYKEGSATTYGKTIYNDNGAISIRENKMHFLDSRLMTPDLQPIGPPAPAGSFKVGYHGYANQDFFAYVGNQYNNGSLAYIAGLYTRLRDDLGNGIMNASLSSLGTSLDTYLKSAFGLGLTDIYLDYVKQRALTHNASSQFGRSGEVTSGFAENLFSGSSVHKQSVNLSSCSKTSMQWNGLSPLSTRAIVVNPTGALPAGSNGLNLSVKITPSAGSAGTLKGFTWRANTASVMAEENRFSAFGRPAGDQIVVLVSNLNLASDGSFTFEIGCDGPAITVLSPASGVIDSAVTITGSGFGTTADTRAVYFNGVKAGNVTWNSDTTAVARVPASASSGNVVVEVNTVRSNGMPFTVVSGTGLVTISPASLTVGVGTSGHKFSGTVDGLPASDWLLDWSVLEGSKGGGIVCCDIHGDATYNAPMTVGTYHVVATNKQDRTNSATATVTTTSPNFNGASVKLYTPSATWINPPPGTGYLEIRVGSGGNSNCSYAGRTVNCTWDYTQTGAYPDRFVGRLTVSLSTSIDAVTSVSAEEKVYNYEGKLKRHESISAGNIPYSFSRFPMVYAVNGVGACPLVTSAIYLEGVSQMTSYTCSSGSYLRVDMFEPLN